MDRKEKGMKEKADEEKKENGQEWEEVTKGRRRRNTTRT